MQTVIVKVFSLSLKSWFPFRIECNDCVEGVNVLEFYIHLQLVQAIFNVVVGGKTSRIVCRFLRLVDTIKVSVITVGILQR